MAKNFLKNIFNQTKNNITKKKSIIDSQKLSDIIIINNNESNFFQQKPCDKFNILSNYYPKKEKKNKKENNFLERINELNNKFHISQEKYSLIKSSLDKLNDDLFSNLLKQIDCYIEEIQRLNKKLVIINNDNKEEIIKKLNKKILENERTIRNYKNKVRENANKEEKLNKEIEYYKKRIIFYKNKININLISRKISCGSDENKERENKNNFHSNLKYYNITNNLAKPSQNKIKNICFNQSTGRIIQIRHDRKILSSTDFPNFSGNKDINIRNKLLSKERTIFEKENQVSEFLTDKESKDESNNNLILVNNNTTENFTFSNDSSENIYEQNNTEDLHIFENLNINENINKLNSKDLIKGNNNNNTCINEKGKELDTNSKINEYKNRRYKSNSILSNSYNNNFIHRKSENISLDMNQNLSFNSKNKNYNKTFLKHKNTTSISSFQKFTDVNTTKSSKNKTINRHNTFFGNITNHKSDKMSKEYPTRNKSNKSKITNNKLKKNNNENKKETNISKCKTIQTIKCKEENKIDNKNKNISGQKKIKSQNLKKDSNSINNGLQKNQKEKEVDEKELKKILKDINEDYNNDIEMLNNQENQIKFLLNLMDVNN